MIVNRGFAYDKPCWCSQAIVVCLPKLFQRVARAIATYRSGCNPPPMPNDQHAVHARYRLTARFQARSSVGLNRTSLRLMLGVSIRSGWTLRWCSAPQTRPQNRAVAAANRSSQCRRSNSHHRLWGSKVELWPQRQIGCTAHWNTAASNMQVARRVPAAVQRMIEGHQRSCS